MPHWAPRVLRSLSGVRQCHLQKDFSLVFKVQNKKIQRYSKVEQGKTQLISYWSVVQL